MGNKRYEIIPVYEKRRFRKGRVVYKLYEIGQYCYDHQEYHKYLDTFKDRAEATNVIHLLESNQ